MRHALVFAFATTLAACSPIDDEGASTDSALTVENERFVVSASPERIVLRKRVDGAPLPWGASELWGKALVVFPIKGITDEGVYARAMDVAEDDESYAITTAPLSLEEMEAVTEDQVLIIKRPRSDELSPQTIHPLAGKADPGDGPQISAFPNFNLSGGTSLFGVPIGVGGNVTHSIKTASLQPKVLAEWSKADGLELGVRGSLRWSSTLTITGGVAIPREFFHSKELETPPFVVPVLIGPALAPVALIGRAYVSCSVGASTSVDLTLDIALSADISASMKVNPRKDAAVKDWIGPGRWPAKAGGSASAKVKTGSASDGKIACGVPVVELHAKLGGVAGPYVAIVPTATIGASGAAMETRISAGLEAGMLGARVGASVTLFTIK